MYCGRNNLCLLNQISETARFGGERAGILRLKRRISCFKAALILGLAALFSCTGPGGNSSGGGAAPESAGHEQTDRPLVIIKPGTGPLWFELGPQGPLQIGSPGEASLNPFEPWPFSRLIAGLVPKKDRLILVVNREGFLGILPWAGEARGVALYRASSGSWKDYTVGSLFVWKDTPGVLLYRNDFFLEPAAEAPAFRAWGLSGDFQILGLAIPAFAGLPDDWDAEALRRGQDGFWYYHLVRKGGDRPEHRYYRSADLETPGEESSARAFSREALRPWRSAEASGLLGSLLERAFVLYGREHTAEIASAVFEGSRQFMADPGGEGDILPGCYAGPGETADGVPPGGAAEYALIVNPSGAGLYIMRRDELMREGSFSLPVLPEGFVYTKIGLSGPALIAAWEEQQDLSVGAAGFLVITPPWRNAD
ncbi:MAG: hypothetical protein LBJ24_05635 [Treponema sp.]|jgi:hypothetical protein|nr:hypothetical protein [Treponema sp.]